jgi:hydrogenase 3 maturation protease
LWKNNPSAIIALVGVGNELMGDDAAGMLVIQHLKTSLSADSLFKPVEGGPAPENCTGVLRRMNPSLVVFIDAGNINESPGRIGFFSSDEAEGVSAFGHTLPLQVIGKFLESELDCKSVLLLIQPETIEYDRGVSVPVTNAIEAVVAEFMAYQ